MKSREILSKLIFVYIFMASASVSIYGYLNPAYNWDMIGYVASVNFLKGESPKQISKATYADVRKISGQEPFHRLVAGPYRRGVYHSYKALEQQIPFYDIKIGYIFVLWLLSCFSGSISESTILVSSVSSGLLVLIASLFVKKKLGNISVFVPVLLVSAGILSLARASTPDSIAALAGFACVLLAEKRPKFCFLVIPLLSLIRPDYIIFAVLLLIVLHIKTKDTVFVALSAAASLGIYVSLGMILKSYSYPLLFNFSFISYPVPFPKALQISHRLSNYFNVYVGAMPVILQSYFYVNLICFCAAIFRIKIGDNSFHHSITLAVILYAAAHFVLFPALDTRFYFFSMAVDTIFLFRLFSEWNVTHQTAGRYLKGATVP